MSMKLTVFREMLDYMAHLGNVTDADMNCYVSTLAINTMAITCETDDQIITLEVCFKKKGEQKDGT